ncbi:uncharacterized protein LOC141655110 [Silene latifolia]|uniref:uncharacterized protein LOC141655110 n=1 Tax=Silene latifolia TaxID=37657 RepID=UPI003D775A95
MADVQGRKWTRMQGARKNTSDHGTKIISHGKRGREEEPGLDLSELRRRKSSGVLLYLRRWLRSLNPAGPISLLCYNCRRLDNEPTVVRLSGLLRQEGADVVILVEKKLSVVEMRNVITRLGGYKGVGADSMGRSAGVAVLWKEGVEVEVISVSAHHIGVSVKGLFGIDEWRLSGFYGWVRHEDKWRSWQLLRELQPMSNLPWVVIGDFNEILFEHEKSGGTIREYPVMDAFREAIDECGLMDIGYWGNPFTWWNRRGDSEAIYERLDRALATPSFINHCPTIKLNHLDFDKSDHAPIKLALYKAPKTAKTKKFRFEDMWANDEACEGVIQDAWEGGHEALGKLEWCKTKLAEWSKHRYGNLRKQIEETRKRLMFLDSCAPTVEMVADKRETCTRLDDLLMAEEGYWRQWS